MLGAGLADCGQSGSCMLPHQSSFYRVASKVILVFTLLHALFLSAGAILIWLMTAVVPYALDQMMKNTEFANVHSAFPFRALGLVIMFATVVIGLALMLRDFYRDVTTKKVRTAYAVAGWIGSAAYHGALAWIDYPGNASSGPIRISLGTIPALPLWYIAAAAALASIVLLIWSIVARAPRGEESGDNRQTI